MPLARAINYAHPAASNFFQNLIVPEKPIPVLALNVAEQVGQGRPDPGMLDVTVDAGGKKTVQTKTAPHARCGPTYCTDARFIFELQRDRTTRRTHAGETSINLGSTVANANSQLKEKFFALDFTLQTERLITN
jgi:hypothetical protein